MTDIPLWHERNVKHKIRDNYKQLKKTISNFKDKHYSAYKNAQFKIKGIRKKDIFKKVNLLEKYYKNVDEFIEKYGITSQSKFRPTILEEFCVLLFKDLPELSKQDLNFYNKKIFAGLGVDEKGKTYVKTKDVDLCIGKAITAKIEDTKHQFIIPVVAIECKTYVDKTMFSEAQFTAQTLKKGSPNVKVYILSERNEVKLEEIPTQTPIDQYFVLRDSRNTKIDQNVVWDFFNEVRNIIKKTQVKNKLKIPGRLILD